MNPMIEEMLAAERKARAQIAAGFVQTVDFPILGPLANKGPGDLRSSGVGPDSEFDEDDERIDQINAEVDQIVAELASGNACTLAELVGVIDQDYYEPIDRSISRIILYVYRGDSLELSRVLREAFSPAVRALAMARIDEVIRTINEPHGDFDARR